MERTLIAELSAHKGQEVMIQGWVDVARLQGKMAFFDFRDRTGKVQGVVFGKPEVLEVANELKFSYVVAVTGLVNERPEKMRNDKVQNGDIELEITKIEILAAAEAMPFDLDSDLNLDTLLDYRPLTLRRERERAMFKIQSEILVGLRNGCKTLVPSLGVEPRKTVDFKSTGCANLPYVMRALFFSRFIFYLAAALPTELSRTFVREKDSNLRHAA